MGDAAQIIVTSRDELARIVSDAVREEFARQATEVLTLPEACKLLRTTPPTVRKLIRERGLPVHYRGSRPRFKRSELLDWLEANP